MLKRIVVANRRGEAVGAYSVCSAHPWVLEAALNQARDDSGLALIESTSNQVNQYGGYTGKTPAQFAADLDQLVARAGFPRERLLVGGDHLGPYPWRSLPAEIAVGNACALVRDCVLAGYVKIHLDASMACADDPPGALAPEIAAQRAAKLCAVAEEAWRQAAPGQPAPLYVIGTEVPVPGGEQLDAAGPEVTKPEDAEATVEFHRKAFSKLRLDSGFERIIGLVVQPGVEFGSEDVFAYGSALARALSENLPAAPKLVYEAHSTDYQTGAGLAQMVEDHFAILKVGPWLTFAMREAIYALAAIEQEWLAHRRGVTLSRVPQALEDAMLRDPKHWKDYYSGDEETLRYARKYSYSDRSRYYWPDAQVQHEVQLLVRNLREFRPPLPLLSQFLPAQYTAVRERDLANDPAALIIDRVRDVLRLYSAAVHPHALPFDSSPEPS